MNQMAPSIFPPDHPLNPQENGLHWGLMGGFIFMALEGRRGKDGFSYQILPPSPKEYRRMGSWSAIIPWISHIPVTCAQLPDGRLLTFASNQRTIFPGGPEFTYAATWDYCTGQFVEFNNSRHDIFCGGVPC